MMSFLGAAAFTFFSEPPRFVVMIFNTIAMGSFYKIAHKFIKSCFIRLGWAV